MNTPTHHLHQILSLVLDLPMQVVGCPLYILLYCGLFAFLAVMVDYRAELVVFVLYMRSDASFLFLVESVFDLLLAEGIGLA